MGWVLASRMANTSSAFSGAVRKLAFTVYKKITKLRLWQGRTPSRALQSASVLTASLWPGHSGLTGRKDSMSWLRSRPRKFRSLRYPTLMSLPQATWDVDFDTLHTSFLPLLYYLGKSQKPITKKYRLHLIIPDMDAEFLFLFFMISSYICLEAHDVVPLWVGDCSDTPQVFVVGYFPLFLALLYLSCSRSLRTSV